MKKKYEDPESKMVRFNVRDIVVSSLGSEVTMESVHGGEESIIEEDCM